MKLTAKHLLLFFFRTPIGVTLVTLAGDSIDITDRFQYSENLAEFLITYAPSLYKHHLMCLSWEQQQTNKQADMFVHNWSS